MVHVYSAAHVRACIYAIHLIGLEVKYSFLLLFIVFFGNNSEFGGLLCSLSASGSTGTHAFIVVSTVLILLFNYHFLLSFLVLDVNEGLSEDGCPGSTPSLQDRLQPLQPCGDNGWMEIWHVNGCDRDIQHVPQSAYPVLLYKERDRQISTRFHSLMFPKTHFLIFDSL